MASKHNDIRWLNGNPRLHDVEEAIPDPLITKEESDYHDGAEAKRFPMHDDSAYQIFLIADVVDESYEETLQGQTPHHQCVLGEIGCII